MFWRSKSKPLFKAQLKIKHNSGEYVNINIEGTNENHVSYMANRIKDIFNIKQDQSTRSEFEKVFKTFDDVMAAFDNIFKRGGK